MDVGPRDAAQPVGGWAERLACELGGAATQASLSAATVGRLLRLARDVAHATERLNAPLVAYVAGRHVAARQAAGLSEEGALDEVEEVVRRLLSEPPSGPPGG